MKKSRLFTVLLAIAAALTLLAGSIAVPIFCRPFYYSQIDSFDLVEETGLTEDEIKTAYDEMLDFCIGASDEFSVGVLDWSESGKSHFEDVRVLFILDYVVLICGAIAIVVLLIIKRALRIKCAPILRRGPCFWSGIVLLVAFLIIGGYAATDFDRFFTAFHHVFFPGRENWLFDPATDPIITLLPEDFFANCGILILVILVVGCVILILSDFRAFPTKARENREKTDIDQ